MDRDKSKSMLNNTWQQKKTILLCVCGCVCVCVCVGGGGGLANKRFYCGAP